MGHALLEYLYEWGETVLETSQTYMDFLFTEFNWFGLQTSIFDMLTLRPIIVDGFGILQMIANGLSDIVEVLSGLLS